MKQKDACLFRFKDAESLELRRWDAKVDEQLKKEKRMGIMLTVNERIEINDGPAREKLTLPELEQRLEMYCLALSGAGRHAVRIRVEDGASDEMFRGMLELLRQARLVDHVYVEAIPGREER